MSQDETPLLVDRRGAVTVLTLIRPQARNAMTGRLAQEIEAAVDAFESDADAQVLIVTGAGGSFCAGMDLKAALAGDRPWTDRRGGAGIIRIPPEKPVIAAVEGYAVAGGFEIALACDLIVAASDARFGLPEPRRGLVAAAGGVFRLSQRLPYQLAMELSLTGALVGAARLAEFGLVNRLTAPGAALGEAVALAAEICANAPGAVRSTKQIVAATAGHTDAQMWAIQDELGLPHLDSEDAAEGMRAFAEKRDPVWRGR